MLKTFESGSACIAVWSEQPTLAEADRALLVVQQHRIRLGRPVVLLCVLAPSVKMPDDKVRARMQTQWPQLIDAASTLQFVNLAASGFTASRLFSLIVLVFASRGGKVRTHTKLEPAIAEAVALDPSLKADEIRKLIGPLS